jgi:hypothetical protein
VKPAGQVASPMVSSHAPALPVKPF